MARLLTVEDFRRRARRRLPRMIFDFADGGAGAEVTLRANTAAFEAVRFRPRSLVDVSRCSTATTLLGEHLSLPVLLAPTGLQRLVHRQGELLAAAAAGRAGTVYVASTAAGYSLEEIAAAGQGPLWFQLYMWRDHALVESLVDRAARAGYTALVVTVDVPQVGMRYRDQRNGMTLPPRIGARTLLDGARHPRWVREVVGGPPITFRNLLGTGVDRSDGMSLMSYANTQLTNPGTTWRDLDRLRELWPGRLVVKGLLTADDARAARDSGADGVVVSNHGGRQLDGLPASLEALPEVVSAVGGDCEVLLDGGVRSGADVAKALALGARAVLVGRPYWWGLAVDGERGVVRILDILRAELELTLALLGRADVADLDPTAVTTAPYAGRSIGTGPSDRLGTEKEQV